MEKKILRRLTNNEIIKKGDCAVKVKCNEIEYDKAIKNYDIANWIGDEFQGKKVSLVRSKWYSTDEWYVYRPYFQYQQERIPVNRSRTIPLPLPM